jgi:hypothetical protein
VRTPNKTSVAGSRRNEARSYKASDEEGEPTRNLRAIRTLKKEVAELQTYVAKLDEGRGQEELAKQLRKTARLMERITLAEMEEHERRNPDARKAKHRPGFPQHH